eukprot:Pgem_evm1s14825
MQHISELSLECNSKKTITSTSLTCTFGGAIFYRSGLVTISSIKKEKLLSMIDYLLIEFRGGYSTLFFAELSIKFLDYNSFIDSQSWTILVNKSWQDYYFTPAYIAIGEAVAVLETLQHICSIFAKGRSSTKLLNPFCQRLAMLEMLYNVIPYMVYVPSRLNPADDASRFKIL